MDVRLSWEDLKYVLALSRERTAKRAATKLQVNATTVSRRVAAIEDALGVRLFERFQDGVELTDHGARTIAAAEKMEREVHALDAELRGRDGDLQGDIKLTTLDAFEEQWSPDIAGFLAEYPGINLCIETNHLNADLSRREADVAIRQTPAPPEHLLGRKMCEVNFAVYGSRECLQTYENCRSYSELPWIGWNDPVARATDAVIEKYASGARVPLRVSSMGTLVRAIASGVGVSVMPCYVGDQEERLVRVGSYFEGGTYVWVLTHRQLRATARVKALREAAHDWIERDRDLLEGKLPQFPTVELLG